VVGFCPHIQLTSVGVRVHRSRLSCSGRVRRDPRPFTALGCDVTISPPLGGWRTVFLALGSSMAPRGVGSVLARGLPEPNAFAVSCANAPRFARNTLRATGRNGFDAQIPNANLGRIDEMTPVAVRRPALVPHRGKDALVRAAHTHMKTKQG